MLNRNKKFLIGLSAMFACMLCFLFVAGMQTQSEPEKENIPLTLLYDNIPDPNMFQTIESLKLQQWMNVNQDADSFKTGVLNVQEIINTIDRQSSGGQLPKWMMLDAEDPFFADLVKDPDSPEFKRAQNSLISAIRTLKARYPNTKWSLYGIPNLPYWVEKQGWATATNDERRKILDSVALASAPIVAELDWVSVSIYDYYDPKMVNGTPQSIRGTPASVCEDGKAWRMASVGLSVLLAKGKPVIPMIFPYWAPGGVAPYCQLINPRELMENTILPALKGGANGFALWANMNYRITQVTTFDTDPNSASKEKNFGPKEWRAAFTADYFSGQAPTNWAYPSVTQTLIRKTSQTLLDSLRNIRVYEKLKTLPNSTAP